jgi:hypothetical protein
MNPHGHKMLKSYYTKLETVLSYDRVNAIFTRYFTAYLAVISKHNSSVDQFIYITALEEYYKTHISFATAS